MLCIKCGKEIEPDFSVCPYCGTPIAAPAQSAFQPAGNFTPPTLPKDSPGSVSPFKPPKTFGEVEKKPPLVPPPVPPAPPKPPVDPPMPPVQPGHPKKLLMPILLGSLALVLAAIILIYGISKGGTSVSKNSKVPDEIVEDFIQEHFDGNYAEYSIEHSPNTNLHTDTVDISVLIPDKYCIKKYETEVTYQFFKSDDFWQLQNKSDQNNWQCVSVEYNPAAYLGNWDGNFHNGGWYSANISSIDFENGEITGTFTASISSISLSGAIREYTLDAMGTYAMTEDSDGWRIEIVENGYAFVFELNRNYGFDGVTVYNKRTGYAV